MPPVSTESYAIQYVALVDLLRRDQGNSVIILCDNEEAETLAEQCAVEVCAYWTQWKERRFYGETVLAALQAAYTASRAEAQ